MSDLSPHSIPLPERGWTRERMAQFLDYLAEKGNVRDACKRVGLSREAAYKQRRRDADFARGWAAALVQAHAASVDVLADRAIDGIEEDVWYRGELRGTRRKYDTRLLLAHIGRLDKAAEDEAAQRDAARFDELLAVIAGEEVPEDLRSEDDILPLGREEAMREGAAAAEEIVRDGAADGGDEDGPAAEDGDPEATEEMCIEAFRAGRIGGALQWDRWFESACRRVDSLAARRGEDGTDGGANSEPRTVSDVSTGRENGTAPSSADTSPWPSKRRPPSPSTSC